MVRCVTLVPGLRQSVQMVVTSADTASAVGSGDVPVLATPRLLALAEAAAVAAVRPDLAEGQTTVGTAAALEHMRASPVGATVVVEAELIDVIGRRLAFTFTARQDAGGADAGGADAGGADAIVGTGTMERVLVDRERFISQARR
jgi:fluoroacetyl-CoA thioesterase